MNWIRRLDRHQCTALVMTVIFCAVSAIFVVRQATPGVFWDGQFLKRVDAGRYENDHGYEIALVEMHGDTSRFTYRVPSEYSLDRLFYGEFEEGVAFEPEVEKEPVGKSGEAVLTVSPIDHENGWASVSATYGPDDLQWKGYTEYNESLMGYDGYPVIYEDSWFLEGDGRMLYEPPPQVLLSIAEGRNSTLGAWEMVFVAAPLFALLIASYLYPVKFMLFGSRWRYVSEPEFSDEAIALERIGAILAMVVIVVMCYLRSL